jgi:hypothetical protein
MYEINTLIYGILSFVLIMMLFIIIDNYLSNKIESETSIHMSTRGYEQKECIGSSELKWVKKEDK